MHRTHDSRPVCITSAHDRTRRGATWPSPRTVRGVLEWVDHAQASQRAWARNTLVVVLVLAGLTYAALRVGLLQ